MCLDIQEHAHQILDSSQFVDSSLYQLITSTIPNFAWIIKCALKLTLTVRSCVTGHMTELWCVPCSRYNVSATFCNCTPKLPVFVLTKAFLNSIFYLATIRSKALLRPQHRIDRGIVLVMKSSRSASSFPYTEDSDTQLRSKNVPYLQTHKFWSRW
jgi:hypothetical protein